MTVHWVGTPAGKAEPFGAIERNREREVKNEQCSVVTVF